MFIYSSYVPVPQKFIDYSNKVIDPIEQGFFKVSNKLEELVHSTQYKAISSATKAVEGTRILISHIKAEDFIEFSSNIILIKNLVCRIFFNCVDLIIVIKKIESFIALVKLKENVLKNIKHIKRSSNSPEWFVILVFKLSSIAREILSVPKTVCKFFQLFNVNLKSKLTINSMITDKIFIVCSFVGIISKVNTCNYSNNFLKELKGSERTKFIEEFLKNRGIVHYNNRILTNENLNLLSQSDIKIIVIDIKNGLKNNPKLLNELMHAADKQCVHVLNEKMKINSKNISKIFKVELEQKENQSIELDEIEDGKFIAAPRNYFEELAGERMLQRSKRLKLRQAVKAIHGRLKHLGMANKISIGTKTIGWASSLIGQLEICGIAFPFIFVTRKTLSAGLGVFSFGNFFYQLHKKKEFLNDLEAATGRNKRLNA